MMTAYSVRTVQHRTVQIFAFNVHRLQYSAVQHSRVLLYSVLESSIQYNKSHYSHSMCIEAWDGVIKL